METRRDRGQAAVETVGLVVAAVLALAATAAWLAASAGPPDRPPDVVGAVARPLSFPDGVRYWALPAVPLGREGADEPIGDALRGAGRHGREAVATYLEGRSRFSGAYNRRLRERLGDVLRDPLGVPALPEADLLTPRGLARRALEDVDAIAGYAARLRAASPGERARMLLDDGGAFAADATIEVLRGLARRRVAEARRPPPPPPPPDAPRP